MNQVRKRDAIEAEWLCNYQLIRNLYLSDMSLNDLIHWLNFFENFTVTLKSQLEYRLKKWKISKNIDRDSWRYIDQTINRRKRDGKESDVILCGRRIKQSTIEKETNRHRDTSIHAQNLPRSHGQSVPSSDQIIVCTPQAYISDFEWPQTLPWFKLRSQLQEWLSYTQLLEMTSEEREPLLNLLTSKILLVSDKFDQSRVGHLIPRLALKLAMGMPEYFPGEHLQTAQIIATGTTNAMIPECLKLIFYKVSNNMVSKWDADDFENLHTIISKTGLLGAIDSLRRAQQQDLTIRAFMDNLFRALILFICYNKRAANMESPKTLVKWLLSLGQDPNIKLFLPFSISMALEHATLSRQVDIIKPLLRAGAVVGRNSGSSNPRSIISIVLPSRVCDSEGAHIIRLFLDHYKALNAEEILHAAILLQDKCLFQQTLDIGADISLPIETLTLDQFSPIKSNVVKEETALSTAAAVSIHAASVVFDLLQNRDQVIEAPSFITPDVFVSAACAGNADVISFLHKHNPIGFKRNARGVTALEVAIKHGHQEAYQLLFQLYRQSSATLLLIPIFIDQLEILQYLLENGLDVNLTTKEVDMSTCCFLLRHGLSSEFSYFIYEQKSPTVLELLLSNSRVREDRKHAIELLVRSGAFVRKEAILDSSSATHSDVLFAALDAVGDPSIQHLYVNDALPLALRSKNTKYLRLLLERGAELQTITSQVIEALVPEHVCNIQGERGRCDPSFKALLLEHWASIFDTSKDSVLDIDAAIIAQYDARLKSAFSDLPTYYSPSSLCSAVLVEDHWTIDFLLKNRSLQAPHHILEGTAVGLAAMTGNFPLLRKLVTQLQKPETAILPFVAPRSSFSFSPDNGFDITPSHTFWHRHPSDHGDFYGSTRRRLFKGSPLALAASYRGTAGVLELLGHGYQTDDITWARAFGMDTQDCLKMLMDYNLRVTSLELPLSTLSPLLRYAIQHGNKEAVVWLIELGVDINENDALQDMGRSPVQLAIESGHLTVTETLLRSGSNVNAAPSFFGGVTALQSAAIGGHIGLAKQLLDAGARVNARGSRWYGRTALEGAAERGRLDMVELLLHHRALTTGPGRFQFIRAVHMAVRKGHYATAALLRQSREWTDEDIHTYDSLCADCKCSFSEPRTRSHICDAPGRYCCDEIHMPEDDCYRCYTEDEESRYELKTQEEEQRISELLKMRAD